MLMVRDFERYELRTAWSDNLQLNISEAVFLRFG